MSNDFPCWLSGRDAAQNWGESHAIGVQLSLW